MKTFMMLSTVIKVPDESLVNYYTNTMTQRPT